MAPVSKVTVAVDGTFNDGHAGVTNWWFTMTAGTITTGQNWNLKGASSVTMEGGTLDVAGTGLWSRQPTSLDTL